jgi:hypothetical protein
MSLIRRPGLKAARAASEPERIGNQIDARPSITSITCNGAGRFILHADDMNAAFLELLAAIHRQLELGIKYWEIIADNLKRNAVGVWTSSQQLILRDQQSGSLTRVATTESVSLCVRMDFNNTYVGDFVGTLAADESDTIRIGDVSNGNGAGSLECFIGGIYNKFQPIGGTVVQVTLDMAEDHFG